MLQSLLSETKSGTKEFVSTRAGKIAVIELLVLTELAIWTSKIASKTPSRIQTALLGFSVFGMVFLMAFTLIWFEYRYLTGIVLLGPLPIAILVQIQTLIYYFRHGMSMETEVTVAYTAAVVFGGALCASAAVLAGIARALFIKLGYLRDSRTPEEKVLEDEYDDFNRL